MTPPEFDPGVHHQLGSLDAKVDRILADQDQARSDRKAQYKEIESVHLQIDRVQRNLADVSARLDRIEPITADIGKWRERFIGMRLLIVTISAVFGGLVVAGGKWIAVKLGFV